MTFNTYVIWNRSDTYTCTDLPVFPYWSCKADARKVALHEMGHAEGLGHMPSGSPQSIMQQGALTYHNLKTDDIAGIKAIYEAYP